MEGSGRKRTPLGPLSPSSMKNAPKRPSTPSSHNDNEFFTSSIHGLENVDPNSNVSVKAANGNLEMPRTHVRPLSQNVDVQSSRLSHNVGKNDPSKTLQRTPDSPHPTVFRETLLHNQRSTTPSQRRLSAVDLSGITNQSGVTRILQKSATLKPPRPTFQLPASRISPNNSFHSSKVDKRLLDSYNRDKVVNGLCPGSSYRSHSSLDYYSTRSQKSAHEPKSISAAHIDHLVSPNDSDVTVIIPEAEELNIPLPAWYQPQSGGKKSSAESSNSAARNLINSFNAAENQVTENNIVGEELLIDPADEEEGHQYQRGEYLSDDEADDNRNTPDMWNGYMDLGKPDKICQKCKARMWNEERNNKSSKNSAPTFSLCCRDGMVLLPEERQPPQFLADLLSGGERTDHYLKNIRTYNSMFAFTSIGGKIDHKINNGKGPYCFKLNGQNYHLLGTLQPKEGETPKFCQLYIYDTENEVQNRLNAFPGTDQVDPEIVEGLLKMLDDNNVLAKSFRMARDRFKLNEPEEFNLLLISSKAASGRPNKVLESNEVAALIVGDVEDGESF